MNTDNPWREAILSTLKAHHRYFEGSSENQPPQDLLDEILRTAESRARYEAESHLRRLADMADQLVATGLAIAASLLPQDRHDVAMAQPVTTPGIAPDVVPVIKAWADGAEVQSRYRGTDDQWRDLGRLGERHIPNWMHPMFEWRVRPTFLGPGCETPPIQFVPVQLDQDWDTKDC